MKLVIFGANGPTGRLATEFALAAGHEVTAVTRHPESFPVTGAGLIVAGVDAFDASAVDRVVSGHDAVISTLGGSYTRERVTLYSRGIVNITRAMAMHGVERLVCVSSMAVASEPAPDEHIFFRKAYVPFLRLIGRTVYEDISRMEQLVRDTELDWTIIRAAGLFDATQVSNYRIAEPRVPGRFTSRADLADALVVEAVRNRHPKTLLELVTTENPPSLIGLFLKEAAGIGK